MPGQYWGKVLQERLYEDQYHAGTGIILTPVLLRVVRKFCRYMAWKRQGRKTHLEWDAPAAIQIVT